MRLNQKFALAVRLRDRGQIFAQLQGILLLEVKIHRLAQQTEEELLGGTLETLADGIEGRLQRTNAMLRVCQIKSLDMRLFAGGDNFSFDCFQSGSLGNVLPGLLDRKILCL